MRQRDSLCERERHRERQRERDRARERDTERAKMSIVRQRFLAFNLAK